MVDSGFYAVPPQPGTLYTGDPVGDLLRRLRLNPGEGLERRQPVLRWLEDVGRRLGLDVDAMGRAGALQVLPITLRPAGAPTEAGESMCALPEGQLHWEHAPGLPPDLIAFVQRIIPKYSAPWHLEPLIRQLERSWTRVVRVAAHIPLRHAATETLLFFQALTLLLYPEKSLLYATYSHDLAVAKARKVRRWFEQMGGQLAAEASPAGEWRTSAGGGLLAVGVGGALTGHEFDTMVVDSPYKTLWDGESPVRQKRVQEWWESAEMRLRPGGSAFVVHSRCAEGDLIGHLLTGEDCLRWREMCLPAVAEKTIGEREQWTALWPKRWPLEQLLIKQRCLPPHAWAALYQGRPLPSAEVRKADERRIRHQLRELALRDQLLVMPRATLPEYLGRTGESFEGQFFFDSSQGRWGRTGESPAPFGSLWGAEHKVPNFPVLDVSAGELPVTSGAGLDRFASWHDLTREEGETDEALRTRVLARLRPTTGYAWLDAVIQEPPSAGYRSWLLASLEAFDGKEDVPPQSHRWEKPLPAARAEGWATTEDTVAILEQKVAILDQKTRIAILGAILVAEVSEASSLAARAANENRPWLSGETGR